MIGWCKQCDSSTDRPMDAPKCAREDCPDRRFEPAPVEQPPEAQKPNDQHLPAEGREHG
jgi:hypothetical protein